MNEVVCLTSRGPHRPAGYLYNQIFSSSVNMRSQLACMHKNICRKNLDWRKAEDLAPEQFYVISKEKGNTV